MLLQLDLMLSRQLLVLPLELGDQELPLELLLVFERHQLLLQLRLICGTRPTGQSLGSPRYCCMCYLTS